MAKQAEPGKLNDRQKLFCIHYAQTCNGTDAAIKAGYSARSAGYMASTLLKNPKIQEEIGRIAKPQEEHHIASAQEVMEFFTKMMNGEIKDAFGLDANNGDRLKAAQEIAKRTVDVENRAKGQADTRVEISIDWGRNNQRED